MGRHQYVSPPPQPRAIDRIDSAADLTVDELNSGRFDNYLDEARQVVRGRIDQVVATAKSQGRTADRLLASEQRLVDRFTEVVALIDEREAAQVRAFNRQNDERERRLNEDAAVRMAYPALFGDSPSAKRSQVGTELADAIADVRAGRVASAEVDIEVRNSLTEGADWGQAVPIEIAQTQRTLRARSVVMGIPGVRVVPMGSDKVRYPRLGESTATAVAEADTFDSDDPDLDSITLTAKKFGIITQLSEELVQDFSEDALDLLASNMLSELALKVDHELLEGTVDLIGIRSWPGINTTSVAAVPSNFAKLREVEYELAAANANVESAVWLMHPRSWYVLGLIKTGLSSDETTLLQPNPQEGARTLLGHGVRTSTQITLTEGAGAGSWVGLIDGSQLIVGERLPARIEVSRDFAFDKDLVTLRAKTRVGFGVVNPGAISIATDVRSS